MKKDGSKDWFQTYLWPVRVTVLGLVRRGSCVHCWHQLLTLLVWNAVCGYAWVPCASLELGPSVHSKGFQEKWEERGFQAENWRQARRRGDVFIRSSWEDAAHERTHTHLHINIHIHMHMHTHMHAYTVPSLGQLGSNYREPWAQAGKLSGSLRTMAHEVRSSITGSSEEGPSWSERSGEKMH